MHVHVQRKNIKFSPDNSRVVARFFNNGENRTRELIKRVISLEDSEVNRVLERTLREFAGRHRNISRIFLRHFENHSALIEDMGISAGNFSKEEKLLIGSYSTMEYSIESAAMFNPSIIEDFDQSFLAKNEKRVIISFRATERDIYPRSFFVGAYWTGTIIFIRTRSGTISIWPISYKKNLMIRADLSKR